MKPTQEQNRASFSLQNKGKETKAELAKSNRKEPANQGYFQVDERTKIGIPDWLPLNKIEAWKEKMRQKYLNYSERQAQAMLTGAAKRKMKASL
jgi:hypothetical protein